MDPQAQSGPRESDTTEVIEHAYIVYTNPPSDFLRNKFGGKIVLSWRL